MDIPWILGYLSLLWHGSLTQIWIWLLIPGCDPCQCIWMLWTCPQGDSSLPELCSLKGVIGDFPRDETDRFQCLHLQWRIETPLRVEPSPVSSTMEGSVHQPAVSQLFNTPLSPSHTWVELWPCTSCPAWDPLPSIMGSSTQRCLPFMGWRLDAIAEVKEWVPQQ